MEPQQVLHMLEQVAPGSVSPVDAQRSLADQGYSDLGFAKVDTDRAPYGRGRGGVRRRQDCRSDRRYLLGPSRCRSGVRARHQA